MPSYATQLPDFEPGLGLLLPIFPLPTARWFDGGRLVTQAEQSGASGFWLPDHILWHLDAIDALGAMPLLAAASATSIVGTCVLQMPLRDPVSVAKLATLASTFAPGRFVVGVGIGERVEEYEKLGRDFHTRGRVLDQQIGELRRIWALAEGNLAMRPNVGQLPLWMGGRSDAARLRCASTGDGWVPYLCSPRWWKRNSELLDHDLLRLGRTPKDVQRSVLVFVDVDEISANLRATPFLDHLFNFSGSPSPFGRFLISGTVEQCVDQLLQYRDAGCEHIVVQIANDSPMETFAMLNERYLRRRVV